MKILFIAHYFQPEPNMLFGLPFAKELQKRGHEVVVLTGYPNYPEGNIYPEYKNKLFFEESLDGIRIIRTPLYASHDYSAKKRILSYISLSLSQATIGFLHTIKADVAYVCQGPATIGFPSIFFKWFKRIPFVYNIQDIWPDSLLSTGMFHSEFGMKILHKWCNFVYKQSKYIVVISPGMKSLLEKRGVSANKIKVVHNWCDESQLSINNISSTDNIYSDKENAFNIVYAGNIGYAQGLNSIIEGAKLLSEDNINIILIGEGVTKSELEQKVKDDDISNVYFYNRMSFTDVSRVLTGADALLVHLNDEDLFRVTVPSKLQAYLAIGKPILSGVNGDAQTLVQQSESGLCFSSNNIDDFVEKAIKMSKLSLEELKRMGDKGKKYYNNNLSFKHGVDKYETLFKKIVNHED